MRRTQAAQVDAVVPGATLEEIPCRVCGRAGISIIALGSNQNGAIELHFCSITCARSQGWPWVDSERRGGAAKRHSLPARDS